MFLLISQFVQPWLNIRLIVCCQTICNHSIRSQFAENVKAVVNGITGAGTEWYNRLPTEIKGFQIQ